jgi:hypothetical protein
MKKLIVTAAEGSVHMRARLRWFLSASAEFKAKLEATLLEQAGVSVHTKVHTISGCAYLQ